MSCMMHSYKFLHHQKLLPAAVSERQQERCVALPAGTCCVHSLPSKNPEEKNCAVENYYQLGPFTDLRQRALLDLVEQVGGG